jgi:ABC-type Zn uptake system ZnuABC Zn-binding protein ZnuA
MNNFLPRILRSIPEVPTLLPGFSGAGRLLPIFLSAVLVSASGCASSQPKPASVMHILAAETFLADVAQQVAGDRFTVEALLPIGTDPHAFEPTPRDAVRIAECDLLIINGGGVETWLPSLLPADDKRILAASDGIPGRTATGGGAHADGGTDPHFWLDPILMIRYVENIRAGFVRIDPAGEAVFSANAEAYSQKLRDLDQWIQASVSVLPIEKRILVTNHDSLGYFADRYDFQILGTLVPGTSSESEPSARQMAQLVDLMRTSGAKAIFLDTGTNPQLADQIASETGARVVASLYIHSLSGPDGEAPTYLEMMRRNVETILEALQ